jgi:hypothetical protein
MINDVNQNPEVLWDHLLSRQPKRIRAVFETLSKAEQNAVRKHLERMANENGWHKEQRTSAQAALQALE